MKTTQHALRRLGVWLSANLEAVRRRSTQPDLEGPSCHLFVYLDWQSSIGTRNTLHCTKGTVECLVFTVWCLRGRELEIRSSKANSLGSGMIPDFPFTRMKTLTNHIVGNNMSILEGDQNSFSRAQLYTLL